MTGQGFVLPNDLFSNDLLSQDLLLLARRRALVTSGVALFAERSTPSCRTRCVPCPAPPWVMQA